MLPFYANVGLSLLVVFTGSDHGNEAYVRRVAHELEVYEHLFFLGYVPRQTLRALCYPAFVLCYVSFLAPDNLPPLEAFAAGCPVIAADVPGASEQFDDAAIRVNLASDLQIADALKSLLRDTTKRANLIARGKERAHRYTTIDLAKSLLASLDEFRVVRRCRN